MWLFFQFLVATHCECVLRNLNILTYFCEKPSENLVPEQGRRISFSIFSKLVYPEHINIRSALDLAAFRFESKALSSPNSDVPEDYFFDLFQCIGCTIRYTCEG